MDNTRQLGSASGAPMPPLFGTYAALRLDKIAVLEPRGRRARMP